MTAHTPHAHDGCDRQFVNRTSSHECHRHASALPSACLAAPAVSDEPRAATRDRV